MVQFGTCGFGSKYQSKILQKQLLAVEIHKALGLFKCRRVFSCVYPVPVLVKDFITQK